jgi:hypothetical protein
MQSNDQFRLAFDVATERLNGWAKQHADCADLIVEGVGQFWRLGMSPKAANACPVELILHRDTQNFDIQLGSEVYEGIPIDGFDLFEPLLDAVVAGTVVTRLTTTAAGAVALKVETIVQPENRLAWIAERLTPIGQRMVAPVTLTRDRHWVPYRRA